MPPMKNAKKGTLKLEPRPVRNTRNQDVNYLELSAAHSEKLDKINSEKGATKKNGDVKKTKPKTTKAKAAAKEPKKKNEPKQKIEEAIENGEEEEEESTENEVVEKPVKKTTKKTVNKTEEKTEETTSQKRKAAEEKKTTKETVSSKKPKKDAPEEETANDEDEEETLSQEKPAPKQKEVAKPGKSGRNKRKVEPDSTVTDDTKQEEEEEAVAEEEVSEPKKLKGKKIAERVSTMDDKKIEEAPKKGRKPKKEVATTVTAETEEEKPKIETKKYNAAELECDKKSQKGDKWNLKICSWNVDGYRAWINKKGHEFLQAEKPDIFCIQEVRCPTDKLPSDVILADYHNYWLCGEKDGYAGVGLLSKKMPQNVEYGLGNPELDEDGRIITAEYSTFYVVCTYVPNAGRGLVTLPKRLKWNEALLKHLKNLDQKKPVVLCGDMNVAHNEIDLANPKTNKKNAGFTPEERQGMTDLLGNGFVDSFRSLYPDQKAAYTFWTYMKNSRAKNVGWRLDYFILSERIVENICDQVLRTDVLGSDHCPVTLFMYMRGLPEREIQRGSDAM